MYNEKHKGERLVSCLDMDDSAVVINTTLNKEVIMS